MQTYRFKIMQCAAYVKVSLIVSLPLLGEDRSLHVCIGCGIGPTTEDAMDDLTYIMALEMAT